jgi:chemosensory pili system protein ChpC
VKGEKDIETNVVVGVTLPAGSADLLLPNAAVAEILTYHPPTPVPGGPDWLIGNLVWQQRPVPVVSVAAARAAAEGEKTAPGRRTCLVVCYVPSGNRALPYVALLAFGPPHLGRFRPDNLKPAQAEEANPFVLHTLTYAGRPAWIPDMDAIARAVLEAAVPQAIKP